MMKKTNKSEMLIDILWLLSVVRQVSDYRIDYDRLKEIREKYE